MDVICVDWSLASFMHTGSASSAFHSRWQETRRAHGAACMCVTGHAGACWDQSTLSDTIWSAVAGRPIYWRCLEPRFKDKQWEQREGPTGLKVRRRRY